MVKSVDTQVPEDYLGLVLLFTLVFLGGCSVLPGNIVLRSLQYFSLRSVEEIAVNVGKKISINGMTLP